MSKTPGVLMLDLGMGLRGGQRQVLYLASYLSEQGIFQPLLACPRGSALEHAAHQERLSVLPLPGRTIADPRLWWSLLSRIIQYPTLQIIHTHDAHAALVGACLKQLWPRLFLIHSRRVSYPARQGLRSWKYRVADAAVGVSREIAEQLVSAGVPRERVMTIHSGIDPATYAPQIPRTDQEPFRFLAIGALTRQKGFDVLINAAGLLARDTTLPAWVLQIVGSGPLEADLREQARQLGLFDGTTSLLTMPGRLESRAVLPYSDAVLVPSTAGEGSSATIKEAWATGVPLVASDLASNTELVQDHVNGLLVQTGNPESLADCMRCCLTKPELLAQLVNGGHRTLPAFTHIRMAASYQNLYMALINHAHSLQ